MVLFMNFKAGKVVRSGGLCATSGNGQNSPF